MTRTPSGDDRGDDPIRNAQKQVSDLQQQVDVLQRQRLARGTGNVAVEAVAALNGIAEAASTVLATLEELGVADNAHIAKYSGLALDVLSEVLGVLAGAHSISNIGSVSHACWTRRIGDATPCAELRAHVRLLVSQRPMSIQELADATGARAARVSRVLGEIRRSEPRILNVGEDRAGRWFIIPQHAKPAALRVRAAKVIKR